VSQGCWIGISVGIEELDHIFDQIHIICLEVDYSIDALLLALLADVVEAEPRGKGKYHHSIMCCCHHESVLGAQD
jgi:hypothetical protein